MIYICSRVCLFLTKIAPIQYLSTPLAYLLLTNMRATLFRKLPDATIALLNVSTACSIALYCTT